MPFPMGNTLEKLTMWTVLSRSLKSRSSFLLDLRLHYKDVFFCKVEWRLWDFRCADSNQGTLRCLHLACVKRLDFKFCWKGKWIEKSFVEGTWHSVPFRHDSYWSLPNALFRPNVMMKDQTACSRSNEWVLNTVGEIKYLFPKCFCRTHETKLSDETGWQIGRHETPVTVWGDSTKQNTLIFRKFGTRIFLQMNLHVYLSYHIVLSVCWNDFKRCQAKKVLNEKYLHLNAQLRENKLLSETKITEIEAFAHVI